MNSLIDIKEPLILASKSPRRAQLLRQIGLDFRVIAGDMAEKMDNSGEPAALAVALSLAKAQHVADKVAAGLVIGADTIVVLQEKFLGKPADREEAFTMLRYLSGRTHQVYT
ncbi:MAG TPA: septum formation inhibitor Maf, partial [Bacteroidetes bacterium]|nr:septum formation inhibitor Maf [Bacteroidota bacterium]